MSRASRARTGLRQLLALALLAGSPCSSLAERPVDPFHGPPADRSKGSDPEQQEKQQEEKEEPEAKVRTFRLVHANASKLAKLLAEETSVLSESGRQPARLLQRPGTP